MTSLPSSIRITDVSPRDGLQNESAIVNVDDKVAFINLLSGSGPAEIEVTSFVSPKWVPQLADAEEVLARIERSHGVVYSALVPNEAGLERAIAAQVGKIAVFTAASESFSRKNTNASIVETIERFRPVVAQAHVAKLAVRGYVSTVVACPYEGPISPMQVRSVVLQLLELGVDEIDLGETIGVAAPADIERLYEGLADLVPPQQTTLHLHDTRGTALACAYRAMELGVSSFDASCAGLGGCPFAPGAAGNLATEDLAYLAERCGVTSSIKLEALFTAGRFIAAALGRRPPGRVFNVDGAAAPVGARSTSL